MTGRQRRGKMLVCLHTDTNKQSIYSSVCVCACGWLGGWLAGWPTDCVSGMVQSRHCYNVYLIDEVMCGCVCVFVGVCMQTLRIIER